LVSTYYYQSGDLQKDLKEQIRSYYTMIVGTEYPFIWKSYNNNANHQELKFLNASLLTLKKLIVKYFADNIVYHSYFFLLYLLGKEKSPEPYSGEKKL
jgi:uncharacterized protein YtpQ (UPF0354 family)